MILTPVLVLLASPPALHHCPIAPDGGALAVQWADLSNARWVLVSSPTGRVVWMATPAGRGALPTAACVDGGVRLSDPSWLPFELQPVAQGEGVVADVSEARSMLLRAWGDPSIEPAISAALESAAHQTAYRLAGVANEGPQLTGLALDLDVRARVRADPRQLAWGRLAATDTDRGRALRDGFEAELRQLAPLVIRDPQPLEDGLVAPAISWRGNTPCWSTPTGERCAGPAVGRRTPGARVSKGVQLRGLRVTLRHRPPTTAGSDDDGAFAGAWFEAAHPDGGVETWPVRQVTIEYTRPARFPEAPSEISLSPDGTVGVALVPSYASPTCVTRKRLLVSQSGCEAVWRRSGHALWRFEAQ